MKKKLQIITTKLYTKIKYCIKYLWYLLKPKLILLVLLPFAVAALSWFSYPYVKKYVQAPRAPRLQAEPSASRYLYAASPKTAESFGVYIGEKSTNSPKVEVSFGQATKVAFAMTNINPNMEKPTKEGNKLVFANVRNQVDLTYEPLSNGVKEEIVVKAPQEDNAFTFDLNSQGAIPKKDFNGVFSPFFYNTTTGAYVFHLAKPYAYDKKGERTDNVAYKIKRTGTDAEYQVTVVVDQDWLLDPKRVYPVAIDPTIVHDTTAEFSPGQLNRVTDTGSGASPSIETYYQELPADINTVGLWHMNEASGNALDSSGNGNTGTATGTTVVAGKLGKARSFVTNDYITHPTTGITPAAATIEMWVKPNWNWNDGVAHGLWQNNNNTNVNQANWVSLFKWSSNNLYFRVVNPSAGIQDCAPMATNYFNAGQWTHVAAAYNSSGMWLYVNGSLVCSTGAITVPNAALDTNGRIGFGHQNSFGNGVIDEVRISNTARTAEEIKLDASRRPYSVYTSDVIDMANVSTWNPLTWTELGVNTGDGETVASSTGLVAQWKFNETSGITASDSSGNSKNGTLTNMTTTGQDTSVNSGWTANNKRWGTGAVMFDNSDDYISLPNDLGYTTQVSAFAWFKSTGSPKGSYHIIFGPQELEISVPTTGEIRTGVYTTSRFVSNHGSGLNDGNWHYVGFTFDGSTKKSYIDGKYVGEQAVTGTLMYSFANRMIGRFGTDTTYALNGIIDSTTIYSRA
ncbi:LamG domain-containing protein, partial [Patescibacteria group bacterium]|nr:LamG domain-containing protein [Patescibacteria group bacterium]MBU1473168.1 LamG domain-containing protein [Patescibacteria group bacterium]MBU2459772.1 LamG domain-containing protein [Patescibacteria group bacterium]